MRYAHPQWYTEAEMAEINADAPAMQAEADAAKTYPELTADPEPEAG